MQTSFQCNYCNTKKNKFEKKLYKKKQIIIIKIIELKAAITTLNVIFSLQTNKTIRDLLIETQK